MVVPAPGVESISMLPPIDCITRWQNMRPMPLPPDCARVVTGSRVSLASTSGGMPGPLSAKGIMGRTAQRDEGVLGEGAQHEVKQVAPAGQGEVLDDAAADERVLVILE